MVHGWNRRDGERGRGGAGVAGAVGEEVPGAGAGGLPKPLIGVSGGTARGDDAEGGVVPCYGCLADGLGTDRGCGDRALDLDGEMREGLFSAGVDSFEGEEMYAVGQAGDLHGAADDRAAGGGGDDGDGGRGAVEIGGDKVDHCAAVGGGRGGVGDGERGCGVAVEIGELAIDGGAIFCVTEKRGLRAVVSGVDCLGIAELVGGLLDV